MRTSAPAALASSRLPSLPGTRIRSPKHVKITPGSCATAMPSSRRPIGITHTGHPGPCTSSTLLGSRSSMPYLKIVCVCPPHTSMIFQCLSPASAAMRAPRARARSASRNSSANFMPVSRCRPGNWRRRAPPPSPATRGSAGPRRCMPGPSPRGCASVSAASVSLTRLSANPDVHEHILARLGCVLTHQQRRVDPALHTAELHLAVHAVLVDVLDETGGNR